ncbi:nitroreductase [Celerinatantimonas sp. MCCC 1A17872]|uniref:nitroreductase n=1 Tax=Celerinatantimonas sp. MCCC 1A17872 TaxID=3177514 RepID=UPI0038C02CED
MSNHNGQVSGSCRSCTLMLMYRCYKKHWWFHLIRDPLVAGMYLMAFIHGIHAKKDYICHDERCQGCIRFMKTALLERSALFRFLHQLIGPQFRRLVGNMMQEQDMKDAKQRAAEFMQKQQAHKAP